MQEKTTGRRERKRGLTRKSIITAAMELFAERDYDSVTVDQIAEHADVAKGTLYAHFRTKEEIAAAVYRVATIPDTAWFEEQLTGPASSREILTLLFQKIATHAENNPVLTKTVFSQTMSQNFLGIEDRLEDEVEFTDLADRVVQRGQKRGDLRTDIESRELTTMLCIVFATTVWGWSLSPQSDSLSKRIDRCLQFCLEGMTS